MKTGFLALAVLTFAQAASASQVFFPVLKYEYRPGFSFGRPTNPANAAVDCYVAPDYTRRGRPGDRNAKMYRTEFTPAVRTAAGIYAAIENAALGEVVEGPGPQDAPSTKYFAKTREGKQVVLSVFSSEKAARNQSKAAEALIKLINLNCR
jgi:hypothetical protein